MSRCAGREGSGQTCVGRPGPGPRAWFLAELKCCPWGCRAAPYVYFPPSKTASTAPFTARGIHGRELVRPPRHLGPWDGPYPRAAGPWVGAAGLERCSPLSTGGLKAGLGGEGGRPQRRQPCCPVLTTLPLLSPWCRGSAAEPRAPWRLLRADRPSCIDTLNTGNVHARQPRPLLFPCSRFCGETMAGRRPRPSAHSPPTSGLGCRNRLGPAPPHGDSSPRLCSPMATGENPLTQAQKTSTEGSRVCSEVHVACAGPFGLMCITVEPLDADAVSPGPMAMSMWAVSYSRAQGGPGLGQHPWDPADGPGTQPGQRVQPPGSLS